MRSFLARCLLVTSLETPGTSGATSSNAVNMANWRKVRRGPEAVDEGQGRGGGGGGG